MPHRPISRPPLAPWLPCVLILVLCACCADEGMRPPNGDVRLCEVEPDTIDFGTVETGEIVDTMAIVTNTGEEPFTCFISEDSRHYEIVSTAGPDTLLHGDRLVAAIRFRPDTVGEAPCRIATGCAACGEILCTGIGVELSICAIEPAIYDFGTITAGEHRDTTFTIHNAGDGIIRGEIRESSEYYSILAGAGPYAIGADESLAVTVRYEPLTAGFHHCTIETGTATCTDVMCNGFGEYRWQMIESGTTEDLFGVWGSSSTDVLAVGSAGTVVRYDGSSWKVTRNIAPLTLYDVWGTTAYDIFVVGAARTLLHYNGSSWGFMPSPAAGDLFGLDGAAWNNVFAAGTGAIHYDGTAWSTSLESNHSLNDIWMCSPVEAYAVDSDGIIHHLRDGTWSTIDLHLHGARLNAVWGTGPNDIFVVSADGDIYHFDGTNWLRSYTTIYYELIVVWGSAPDDVFAAGRYLTILHYNGDDWTILRRDGTWEDYFRDIWGSSESDVFFVGTNGTIYHYGSYIQ